MELIGEQQLGRPARTSDYLEIFKKNRHETIERLARDEFAKFEILVGSRPTHVTTHKGIHGNFKLLQYIIDYVIPVCIPITDLEGSLVDENYAAKITLNRSKIRTTDHIFLHIKGADSQLIKEAYLADLATVKEGEPVELLLHPIYFDEELLVGSSLNFKPGRDLAIAIDPEFKIKITTLGFELITYAQL